VKTKPTRRYFPHYVGPYCHSMACPQLADGGYGL